MTVEEKIQMIVEKFSVKEESAKQTYEEFYADNDYFETIDKKDFQYELENNLHFFKDEHDMRNIARQYVEGLEKSFDKKEVYNMTDMIRAYIDYDLLAKDILKNNDRLDTTEGVFLNGEL